MDMLCLCAFPCLPIATLSLGQVEEGEPGLPPAVRMNKSKEHNVPLGRD